MDDQHLYSKLYNGITDLIVRLQTLQQEAEERYLANTDQEPIPFTDWPKD